MRAVIQRVSEGSVTINENIKSTINQGLLVLLGVEEADTDEDIQWLCNKILSLRIFNDTNDIMNLSVKEIEGEILVISQFTLHARVKKEADSYTDAAKPEISIPLYEKFVAILKAGLGREVQTGEFGANMKVSLINDGPVTIIIDTKTRDN